MRSLISRVTLVAALAAGLASCGPKSETVTADDMTQGNPNAKVTVVEYASASCSHCAQWNEEVYPAFKAKYIDTGKVNYVYREILTPPNEVAAAAFLMARCAGKDKYFQVVDSVYRAQHQMFQTGQFREGLLTVAQSAGMSEEQFNACVTDEKGLKALNDRVQKYSKEAKIQGTPTFVVNGKKVGPEEGGARTLAELDAAIAEASK
ncbi:DsbA family protein [Caulobacter segnis]|jgi:protein-disulfide isomerase|uniref:DSBA oxidoreductase n=2 Tax=Caulobacter segnis TaxID=88688 RepID=D5VE46_CAUST|nr:DsbA family protein [Caulobacter segnis]ADG08869.1 DSBA oxidoreductase [Caulobacter segnis ATCC 21756]AVQ00710.1 DsbA family protein [Caulobacter segnis]